MTCMVVCFPGAPRPCEEAISKEMALDEALSHKVAGEQVKWPVGGVAGQFGLLAHLLLLLLRAVCLCSGTSRPKHGFQDPGLRGHPGIASWRRATQQVSRGGRMGQGDDRTRSPEGFPLLFRAAVIAEAYSKLHQTPGECQEVRQPTLHLCPLASPLLFQCSGVRNLGKAVEGYSGLHVTLFKNNNKNKKGKK